MSLAPLIFPEQSNAISNNPSITLSMSRRLASPPDQVCCARRSKHLFRALMNRSFGHNDADIYTVYADGRPRNVDPATQ